MTWHFVLCCLKHKLAWVPVCEDVSESSALGIHAYKTAVQEAPEMLWACRRTTIDVHNRGVFSSVLLLYFPLSWCMSLFLFVISPSISSIPLVSGSGGSCSSCGLARVWVCPDHLSWGSVCSADSASVCVPCSIGAWPTSQPGWRPTPEL